MNELGNTPADKDYKPSGISKAEERALEEYPNEHFVDHTYAEMCRGFYEEGYEQAEKDLGWHSVDESLPPIDEEVIALTNESNGHTLPTACRICFAHRPDPNGDAYTYDGWNIPGIKYWMHCPELEDLK